MGNPLYPRKCPVSSEKSLNTTRPICGKKDTPTLPHAPLDAHWENDNDYSLVNARKPDVGKTLSRLSEEQAQLNEGTLADGRNVFSPRKGGAADAGIAANSCVGTDLVERRRDRWEHEVFPGVKDEKRYLNFEENRRRKTMCAVRTAPQDCYVYQEGFFEKGGAGGPKFYAKWGSNGIIAGVGQIWASTCSQQMRFIVCSGGLNQP